MKTKRKRMLKFGTTARGFARAERGFARAEFLDRYGAGCSLQKSSIANEDCIWLGADDVTRTPEGTVINTRMHLTREMAAELSDALAYFAQHGELPK